jgi:hypothetical protein
MKLTPHTPIPTAARGKVRALVKAHPHWHLFLEANELISASAKNSDLIKFALFHPALVTQIEQLLDACNALTLSEQAEQINAVMRPANQIDIDSIVTQIEALLRQQKPRVRVRCLTKAA